MAKNRIISPKTARDIDKRVERVLRGLGDPEPPLQLIDARELLKLDREFYTADDPSVVQEVISRLRIGRKQVLKRPTLLFDAISKFSLKSLYLPDGKRILLDKSQPKLKYRWNEAHEIGHSLIPWHEDLMFGDNSYTLSRDCKEQVEAEANYAAGRLLFLRDRFRAESRELDPSIRTIRTLQKLFGNTLETTLYRFIETYDANVPIVGMITGHPHVSKRAKDFDPSRPCKHFIQSLAFAQRFRKTSEAKLFAAVARYCGAQRGGSLGEREIVLIDDNGDQHRFHFETFSNTYNALTLGTYLGPAKRILIASV